MKSSLDSSPEPPLFKGFLWMHWAFTEKRINAILAVRPYRNITATGPKGQTDKIPAAIHYV